MNFNFHQKAIILNNENKFLALKSTYKELLWDIPGGKVELPEGTEVALRREVKEETGLDAYDIKPVFISSSYNTSEDLYVLVIIYICHSRPASVVLSLEHSEYGWFTKEEFMKLNAISYLKEYISKIDIVD